MQLRFLPALAAVTLAVRAQVDGNVYPTSDQLSIAQHNQRQSAYLSPYHAMPKFKKNIFELNTRIANTASDSVETASPRERRTTRVTSSGTVGPGKVLTKSERSQRQSIARADSTVASIDGQLDEVEKRRLEDEKTKYAYSFVALKDKVIALISGLRWFRRLGQDIDEHFSPAACTDHPQPGRSHSVRSVVVLVILLLIVFGSLYTVVEYLLSVTRASASACSVSTIFLPVTYTVTAPAAPSSPNSLESPFNDNSSSISGAAYMYTSTSTETLTSYVTVPPTSTTSTLPYVYTVNPSGSTFWVNGVSPSSGASVVTATTSVYITPGETTGTVTLPSTTSEVTYLTLPTITSTVFSYIVPDITLTSTSTSTHYITATVARVSSATSRSSFSGMASGGWNTSTSAAVQSPAAYSSLEPGQVTHTSVYYRPASSDPSTSTTTTYITSTIVLQYTTTVAPSSSMQGSNGYITTITALPVTISGFSGPDSSSATVNAESQSSRSYASTSAGTSISSADAITTTMSPSSSSSEQAPTQVTTTASMSSANVQSSNSSGTPVLASSTGNKRPYGSLSAFNTTTTASLAKISQTQPIVTSTRSSSNSTVGSMGSRSRITHTMSSSRSSSLPSSSAASNGTLSSTSSMASTSGTTTANGTAAVSAAAQSSGILSTLSTGKYTRPQHGPTRSPNGSAATTSSPTPSSTTLSRIRTTATRNATTQSVQRSKTSSSSLLPVYGGPSTLSKQVASTDTHGNMTSTISRETGTLSRSSSPSGSASPAAASSSKPSTIRTQTTTNSTAASSITESSSQTSRRPHKHSTKSTTTASSHPISSSSSAGSSHNPFPVSSATATPSAGCGEHGNFMMDFDDLPNFMPTENDTTITQAPPIPNPYHHLTFSDGYVYAPAPSEPYPPISPPHLAVFLSNAAGMTARGPARRSSKPGEISDGPYESESAFWFDAYSAWFGCDDPGPKVCTLVFSAYTWSAAKNDEVSTFTQNATIAPCPHFKDCHLQQVGFPTSFRGLTGLQIRAFVDDEPRMFFVDDMAMRWSNNSCAAGMLRQRSQ